MAEKQRKKRYGFILITVCLVNLILIYLSLSHGLFKIGGADLLKTLLRLERVPQYDLLIFELRLPRILAAGLAGAALGVAGAVTQGVTRNGLADPGVLGINAGAGLGVVVYMALVQAKLVASGWLGGLIMPLFGLLGGLSAAGLIFFSSWQNGRLDSERLVLTGIAIGSGLGAAALYLALKMSPGDFQTATVWLAGSVANVDWRQILLILFWIVVLIPFILKKSSILDLLQLEESTVKSLGVAVGREKMMILLSGVGLVSVCVAVAGGIGFVGLIVPHLAKALAGFGHRRTLPLCIGSGMALVIGADFLGRTLFAPAEVAVGIVVALIGAPYFIYVLLTSKAYLN